MTLTISPNGSVVPTGRTWQVLVNQAIEAALAGLDDLDRAHIEEAVDALMRRGQAARGKGIGRQSALEALAAVGLFVATREQRGRGVTLAELQERVERG